MKKINIYNIVYNSETLDESRHCGFDLIDNMKNERPDWYEYWPIRNFFNNNKLNEGCYYGFFSPKFTKKTSLSFNDVSSFIEKSNNFFEVDVALFSPQPDMSSNFLNAFEQAEVFDEGFLDASNSFFKHNNINIDLKNTVMDSRQVVFSNYIVAKPIFWRKWFDLTESLFDICESDVDFLSDLMRHKTSYGNGVQRKVFLIERIASIILYLNKDLKVAVHNPFGFGWSTSKFRNYPDQTYINEALKRAYCDTGFEQFFMAFKNLRNEFINK